MHGALGIGRHTLPAGPAPRLLPGTGGEGALDPLTASPRGPSPELSTPGTRRHFPIPDGRTPTRSRRSPTPPLPTSSPFPSDPTSDAGPDWARSPPCRSSAPEALPGSRGGNRRSHSHQRTWTHWAFPDPRSPLSLTAGGTSGSPRRRVHPDQAQMLRAAPPRRGGGRRGLGGSCSGSLAPPAAQTELCCHAAPLCEERKTSTFFA